jgi:hypothetical protein
MQNPIKKKKWCNSYLVCENEIYILDFHVQWTLNMLVLTKTFWIESSLCLINAVFDGSKSSLIPMIIRILVEVLYPTRYCWSSVYIR